MLWLIAAWAFERQTSICREVVRGGHGPGFDFFCLLLEQISLQPTCAFRNLKALMVNMLTFHFIHALIIARSAAARQLPVTVRRARSVLINNRFQLGFTSHRYALDLMPPLGYCTSWHTRRELSACVHLGSNETQATALLA